jgi:hypothetical protein
MEFRCKDDPEANSRKPLVGEQRFSLKFPLENGEDLILHCGKETFDRFAEMIGKMMVDDELEASGEQHS